MNMPMDDAPVDRPPSGRGAGSVPPRLVPIASFLAGLLIGWWLLGWWLFPVTWGPATPAQLDPASQADYVQLVADAYAQAGDIGRASSLLDDLDGITLGVNLRELSAEPGSVGANASALARGLGIDLSASDVVAAAAARAEQPAGSGLNAIPADAPATSSPLADDSLDWPTIWYWVSLIALTGVFLASLFGLWSWWHWRKGKGGPWATLAARPSATSTRGSASRASAPPAEPQPPARSTAAPVARAEIREDLDATRPLPQVTVQPARSIDSAPRVLPASPALAARRRGTGSPSWQPARVELGQTVDARYHIEDVQTIHTWLVYDPRGALVGGAGLMAQPIGGVNTLDLWFSDREDVDQTSRTPTLTFVTQRTYEDPVLRARLSDRRLVPAVPGRSARLETVDLLLEVEVIAVEPPLEDGQPSLQALVLALTPFAQPGTGLHRAVASRNRFEGGEAETRGETDRGWDEIGEDELDEAFDPPRLGRFGEDG